MRKIKIPLFWKFTIVSTIVVLVFGSVNVWFLWNSVYKSFENELDKRCIVLSSIIAEKSLNHIVYGDTLSLYNLLDEVMSSDPDISYIFLLDENQEVIAKTHNLNVPRRLVDFNLSVLDAFSIKVLKTAHFKHNVVRDIAFPILEGEIGIVRLGVAEDQIRFEFLKATRNMTLMITAFFLIGIVGALFFSYLITSPIKVISRMASEVDLESLDQVENKFVFRKKRNLLIFYLVDELDYLVTKFSEMLKRLKGNFEKLKDTQQSLIQAEKMASIGILASGVAHEINNPISGMKNCVSRIKRDPTNYKQNEQYMELIDEAVVKIEGVVKGLLNFGRKQDIEFAEVNLIKIIESAILLASYKLQKNEIKIVRKYPEQSCWLRASSNHLEQVFLNLILNSTDAIIEKSKEIPELEGEILIEILPDSKYITVIVRDNGKGIPDNIRDSIFDPFFTSKEVGKGTGLGLSISYNLIKEHGGTIAFKSVNPYGSEFGVTLPCDINA